MNHHNVACCLKTSVLKFVAVFCALAPFAALETRLLGAEGVGEGRITGVVTSNRTRNALQGALITIPSINRSALSDSTGSFLLQNVPTGAVELLIGYTGFNEERQVVTVRAGESTTLDVELKPTETILMDAFTVATEKEGAALSVTEQRNAANIKNVTALDEWGTLPTMSVGELAIRMPGVTFTLDDDNVVNNVSIRGMDAGFTRLNVDGMSATAVGGNGRTATFHSFSGAMYEQIEIIAGQTPDKRADSIGGQLNLKTRSPLSMKERRRITYNLGARWAPSFARRNSQREDHPIHPSTSLSYMERFDILGGVRNLGLSFNASYVESVNSFDRDILLYQSTTNPVAFFNDYQNITGLNHRLVYGFNLRGDYQLSPQTRFTASLVYNIGREPFFDRTRINTWSNSVIAGIDANGQPTGPGGVLPGFTENRTEIRPVAGSVIDLQMWRYHFNSRNPTATFAADHDLGWLKVDYALRYSHTDWESGSRVNRRGGELTMRATPIGFTLDKSDLDGIVFRQLSGPSIYNPSSYTANLVYTKRDSITDIDEGTGNVNAAYRWDSAFPVVAKAGVDYIERRFNGRQRSPRRWNRVTGAPPISGDLMSITRFEEQHGGQRLPVFDPTSVHNELSNPALWTEDLFYNAQQPYVGRRLATEGVTAGYVQAQARVKRLTVLGGVRSESVDVDAFTYARYRTTPAASEPDPQKRAAMDYGSVTYDGSYSKLFPSIHFSYDVTPNLKARASWSTSYGRPTFQQLVPAVSANDATQTVNSGNAALRPLTAKNIDLKLEYYFKNNGIFTVSHFRKDIKDYILNATIGIVPIGPDNGFDGNYGGYALVAPTNGGTAEVRGWEAEYRQRLAFLPGLLKGLVFSANYTYLETEGNFGVGVFRANGDVPGFIPRAANVRLVYNYRDFGCSVAVNFTGEHLDPLSGVSPPANRFYRKDLTTVNAGVTYRLRPEATLFLDVTNIGEDAPEQYRFIESRIRQRILATTTVSFGVTGQF